ncbi:DUF805 domain-containing protein [Amycolatopsis sp. MtRt-6]|uniref:DUF805 domain-containing protein n=1 Tax=Amycolatopsis sp. MtRt-6 TaxID=2792782 RepID=UPI001A8F2717|nr:DUF805 domain-containing protein [Amycolatopsis sp. MtRt-6]
MRIEGAPVVAGRSRIGFGAALARAVRLSFRFRGRASRPEFWYFFLAYVPLVLTLGYVENVVDQDWFYTLGTVLYLPWLVPFVSVGVRRLHDTGRSGWWCVGVISCVGWIVLTVFWSGRGKPEENRYGPPPG